ncbi:MAG TPA: pyridoxamine 5'-phosphate oxidase family protein [Steroidobacteraceae bacterium]|nr:pyridoxamine 5'-phosphate oxidase family protein [Steroidobacteraceae bacterium]
MSEPRATRPHMPGYGLPEGDEGLMPWSWAEQRLSNGHNYWLATTRPDGRPHLMVVWGLWHQGTFYFSTGRHSRKARNLQVNAHCVFAVEHEAEAVIVEGAAREVADVRLRKQLLSLFEAKYNYDMSSMEEDVLAMKEPIYAVDPARAFGLDEKTTLSTATRWRFERS